MLEGSKLVASIATTDSGKARAFYEGLLGLTFVSDDEFAMVLASDGIQLRVQKVKELGKQYMRSSSGFDAAERRL